MVASKPLIALALLSGANALIAPQRSVIKTVMASTPVTMSASENCSPSACFRALQPAITSIMGFVGFIATYFFVRTIYASIKVD